MSCLKLFSRVILSHSKYYYHYYYYSRRFVVLDDVQSVGDRFHPAKDVGKPTKPTVNIWMVQLLGNKLAVIFLFQFIVVLRVNRG